jgi:hypothetical protein
MHRSTELPQYTKVVLIRDLSFCLGKDNYEWLLELHESETERVMYQCQV